MAMPLALERDATTSTQHIIAIYRDLLCWLLVVVDFKSRLLYSKSGGLKRVKRIYLRVIRQANNPRRRSQSSFSSRQ